MLECVTIVPMRQRFVHAVPDSPVRHKGCFVNKNNLKLIAMLALLSMLTHAQLSFADELTPAEARVIAKQAYIYGFPLVDHYRVQYTYFQDLQHPEYKAPWNTLHNTARIYTPDDKAYPTPNADTPYSQLGADLRSEPLVLTLPAVEKGRYYSAQFVDMYTYNFGYVGSRTTGNGGGTFLLAGPDWKGTVPPGIDRVFRPKPVSHLSFIVPNCRALTTSRTSSGFRPATKFSRSLRSLGSRRHQRRPRSISWFRSALRQNETAWRSSIS